MSRSSSSSGSSTPSPSSSPILSASFDPFAVHPFTNYSGPSNASQPHSVHVLPHPSTLRPQMPSGPYGAPSSSSHYSSHPYQQNSNGIAHPNAIPAGYGSQGSQTHSGGACKPIFVPFRQDTSSPDLSDVLRRKRMPGL